MGQVEEKAKQIGEDLKALQQELSKDPKVTTLDKVRTILKDSENRLYSIHSQIDQANARLADVVHESEREGRRIVQEAKNEAKVILQNAEGVKATALKLLDEVTAREQAVEWVKVEDTRLKALLQNLVTREKSLDAAQSAVNAKDELLTIKLKEVEVRENALATGQPVPVPVVVEPPKKKAKAGA